MSQLLLSRLRAGLQAPQVRHARLSYPAPPWHTNHRPAVCPQLRAWSLGSYGIAAPCALLMRRLSTASPPASTQPGVGANPPLVRCPPCLDVGRGLESCLQPPRAPPHLAACGAVERNRDGAPQRHLPRAQWQGAEKGQGVVEDGGAQVWRVLLHAHEAAGRPQHCRRGVTLASPQLASTCLLGPACGVRLHARTRSPGHALQPLRGSGLRCALGWAGGLGG